jgi:hypothetical protein
MIAKHLSTSPPQPQPSSILLPVFAALQPPMSSSPPPFFSPPPRPPRPLSRPAPSLASRPPSNAPYLPLSSPPACLLTLASPPGPSVSTTTLRGPDRAYLPPTDNDNDLTPKRRGTDSLPTQPRSESQTATAIHESDRTFLEEQHAHSGREARRGSIVIVHKERESVPDTAATTSTVAILNSKKNFAAVSPIVCIIIIIIIIIIRLPSRM